MDKTYWQEFYRTHRENKEASLFAHFVYENYLAKDMQSTKQRNKTSQEKEKNLESKANANDRLPPSQEGYFAMTEILDSKHCKKAESIRLHSCASQAHITPTFLTLLELGCGNGRDSLYFASKGIEVSAIDQASEEIAFLNAHSRELLEAQAKHSAQKARQKIPRDSMQKFSQDSKSSATQDSMQVSPSAPIPPYFIAGDFTQLESLQLEYSQLAQHAQCQSPADSAASKHSGFDCIYSRFTLHSISKPEQDKVLFDCLKLCKEGGIVAIEVRGKKNALFGKGEPKRDENGKIEPNAFIYDNHYRRFLHFTQTCNEIESLRYSAQENAKNATDSTHNILESNINAQSGNTAIATAGGGGITTSYNLYSNPADSTNSRFTESSYPKSSHAYNLTQSSPANTRANTQEKTHNSCRIFGFKILYAKEAQGFAPFNGENDYFIRIIARKECL